VTNDFTRDARALDSGHAGFHVRSIVAEKNVVELDLASLLSDE
jgi:hypothetical protein